MPSYGEEDLPMILKSGAYASNALKDMWNPYQKGLSEKDPIWDLGLWNRRKHAPPFVFDFMEDTLQWPQPTFAPINGKASSGSIHCSRP